MSTSSICVAASRTRHARPVAAIASRSAASCTTAGSGNASISVAHAGTVTHGPHPASSDVRSGPLTEPSRLRSPEHDDPSPHGPHCASTTARSVPSVTPSPLMSVTHDCARAHGANARPASSPHTRPCAALDFMDLARASTVGNAPPQINAPSAKAPRAGSSCFARRLNSAQGCRA